MKQLLKEALMYDAFAEAEKILGEDSSPWIAMALMLSNKEKKDILLARNFDTNSSNQTLEEFFGILNDIGFKEILKLPIEGTQDHFYVLWHSGRLITLDTYMGKYLNSGKAYFNFRGPREVINGSNGLAQKYEGGLIWEGDLDIREGLRYKLDLMSESGEFLKEWVKRPFLWFLHYKDTKEENYNYKEINDRRIAMLPEDIRKAITPKEKLK